MQRIRALTLYQKIVLLILLMMALLFTILYPVTISREGFLYKDAILLPEATETGMVYSGRIDGEAASFTVSEGKVTFQHGDKFYGPYTVREDETAIPQDSQLGSDAVGLEVYCGDDLLFRGAALDQGGFPPPRIRGRPSTRRCTSYPWPIRGSLTAPSPFSIKSPPPKSYPQAW